MSEKFQADPARVSAAVTSMEDLGRLIGKFVDNFNDGLSNAGEILGHDEFGLTAGHQLQAQQLQLDQAVLALRQVADAVPHAIRQQQAAVDRAQMVVIDAISESGAHQGEGASD